MARPRAAGEKELFWIASSHRDLLAFPERVKHRIGTALGAAQFGGKHPAAKPWKGAGSGVLEVVEVVHAGPDPERAWAHPRGAQSLGAEKATLAHFVQLMVNSAVD